VEVSPQFIFSADTNTLLAAEEFRKNIRVYNNAFAFCSMGAKFDASVWRTAGHRIVRLYGALYHSIGSLLPEDESKPQFSQIYIMNSSQQDMAHARALHGHGQTNINENVMLRLQVYMQFAFSFRLFNQ
jgi:hypothetical protein